MNDAVRLPPQGVMSVIWKWSQLRHWNTTFFETSTAGNATFTNKGTTTQFGGGGLTESNRRNYGDDACCTGLSPEWAL